MTEHRLPPSFDLFLDVKDYEQLSTLYIQVCETKQTVEDLCRTHNVTLPATLTKE